MPDCLQHLQRRQVGRSQIQRLPAAAFGPSRIAAFHAVNRAAVEFGSHYRRTKALWLGRWQIAPGNPYLEGLVRDRWTGNGNTGSRLVRQSERRRRLERKEKRINFRYPVTRSHNQATAWQQGIIQHPGKNTSRLR